MQHKRPLVQCFNRVLSRTGGAIQAAFFLLLLTASTGLWAADDLTASASVFSDYNGEDISCVGACDGIATVVATGGTTPYSYLWSDGQLAQVAIGLCAGTYTAIVTDATGCADSVTVTLSDPAPFDVNVDPFEFITGYNVSCPGATDGQATAVVTGGIGPYSYLWSNTQTTMTAVSLPALPLAVAVTDQNGCVTYDSLWMNEPDPFSADSSTVLDLSCPPNVDGHISLYITGGNGSYAYSWSDGPASPIRNNLSPGTYTVTVTDIMGCTFTEDFEIGEASPIATDFVVNMESCEAYLDGAIDLTTVGGTAPYTYKWDNGSTAEDPAGLGEGLYQVTIRDSRECFSTAAIRVDRSSTLTLSSLVIQPDCGTSNGAISVNAQGADGALSFMWSDGQTTATAIDLTGGDYNLLVMDATCSVSRDFNLSNNGDMEATITTSAPGCLDNDGSITATVTGGTGPYTYLWSDGQTNATATNLFAGTYSVIVEDLEGCITYGEATIKDASDLAASSTVSAPLNCGHNDGKIDIAISGGLPPYTIDWSTGSDSLSTQPLKSGWYWCRVTDLEGCEIIETVKVDDTGAPAINLQSTTAVCASNSAEITSFISSGATPYSFLWSSGDTTPNLASQFNGPGALYLHDANGCLQIAQYDVAGSDGVAGIAMLSGISCADFSDGAASIEITEGLPAYQVNWSDGQTGPTASGLAYGAIGVELIDSASCVVDAVAYIGDGCDTLLEAVFDTYDVLEGQANNLAVMSNDIIPSREGVTIEAVNFPDNGSLTTLTDGTMDYMPMANFIGLDSFTYRICDYQPYCDTTTVYLTIKPQFALPDAFSPNNDGFNDFFEIRGISEYPDNELVIMNRWGDEVFRQSAYMGDWRGDYKNGEPLADGTYYYVLDLKNGEDPLAGYIVLQR